MELTAASSSSSRGQENAANNQKTNNHAIEDGIDRISELPDPLIHHILSFLPSTKDAIKACVVSKRWRHQWKRLPVLIFDFSNVRHPELLPEFVDTALSLYESSVMVKFVIKMELNPWFVPNSKVAEWIGFAAGKEVTELVLDLWSDFLRFPVPEFLLVCDSLIQLRATCCAFRVCETVNWRSLRDLHLGCCLLHGGAVESVVSGCPLLESLQLYNCDGFKDLVVASASLRRLVLGELGEDGVDSVLEISCPNLEELKLWDVLYFGRYKLMNLPSYVHVSLDFENGVEGNVVEFAERLVEEILHPVQRAPELHIGQWFATVLSVVEVARGLSSPLLSSKCMIVDVFNFDKCLPGIVWLLQKSPKLEKLTIKLSTCARNNELSIPTEILKSYDFGHEYWKSHQTVFDCLV